MGGGGAQAQTRCVNVGVVSHYFPFDQDPIDSGSRPVPATTEPAGWRGRALWLNGAGSHMRISGSPTLFPTGSWSLHAMILRERVVANFDAIVKYTDHNDASGFALESGGDREQSSLRFWIYTSTRGWVSTPPSEPLPFRQWLSVAIVYDADRWETSLYINGIRTGASPTYAGPILYRVEDVLNVGRDPGHAARVFLGAVDELSIIDRALTPAEAFAIAQSPEGVCHN